MLGDEVREVNPERIPGGRTGDELITEEQNSWKHILNQGPARFAAYRVIHQLVSINETALSHIPDVSRRTSM